jgi:hypothetical protein
MTSDHWSALKPATLGPSVPVEKLFLAKFAKIKLRQDAL